MKKSLELGILVERKWVLDREGLNLGFWNVLEKERWKSDVKWPVYELIYTQFAQAQDLSLERLDTISCFARAQESLLECRIQSPRSFTDRRLLLERMKSRLSKEHYLPSISAGLEKYWELTKLAGAQEASLKRRGQILNNNSLNQLATNMFQTQPRHSNTPQTQ